MHQQPAPLTFPCMPAPNMLGIRFAVMMMPGRVPDHVYGGTAFLAPPRSPPPHRVEAFLFHAVKRAQREGILVTQRRGGEKLPS